MGGLAEALDAVKASSGFEEFVERRVQGTWEHRVWEERTVLQQMNGKWQVAVGSNMRTIGDYGRCTPLTIKELKLV